MFDRISESPATPPSPGLFYCSGGTIRGEDEAMSDKRWIDSEKLKEALRKVDYDNEGAYWDVCEIIDQLAQPAEEPQTGAIDAIERVLDNCGNDDMRLEAYAQLASMTARIAETNAIIKGIALNPIIARDIVEALEIEKYLRKAVGKWQAAARQLAETIWAKEKQG